MGNSNSDSTEEDSKKINGKDTLPKQSKSNKKIKIMIFNKKEE